MTNPLGPGQMMNIFAWGGESVGTADSGREIISVQIELRAFSALVLNNSIVPSGPSLPRQGPLGVIILWTVNCPAVEGPGSVVRWFLQGYYSAWT